MPEEGFVENKSTYLNETEGVEGNVEKEKGLEEKEVNEREVASTKIDKMLSEISKLLKQLLQMREEANKVSILKEEIHNQAKPDTNTHETPEKEVPGLPKKKRSKLSLKLLSNL